MRRRSAWRWLVGLACAPALLLALLPGCGDDHDDALRALEADPLAMVTPPGATLDRSRARAGTDFGTGEATTVTRSFTVADGDVEATAAHLADAARDAGWKLTPGDDLPIVGHKSVDGYPATLSIDARRDTSRVWLDIST